MKIITIFLIFSLLPLSLLSLTLKDGLKLALDNNPEVSERKNSIKMVKQDLVVSYSYYRPKLDFESSFAREGEDVIKDRDGVPNDDYDRNVDEWEFILTQPLFDGGLAAYEESLQKSRLSSSKDFMLESANRVAMDYIEAYINVLKQRDLLDLNQRAFLVSKDILGKIKIKVSKGFGTKLEYQRAQSDLNEARANLASQKLAYRQAKIELRNFLQKDFDTEELIKPLYEGILPKSFEQSFEEAMREHPSMRVSAHNVAVALYEYRRDQEAFYPKVDFVARYGGNNNFFDYLDETQGYSVGVEISYNLYNGGRDSALDKKALSYVDEKKLLIEKNIQQIENQLRLAWNSYETYGEKKIVDAEYAKMQDEVLKTSMIKFDLGSINLTTLLDAHNDLTSAQKSAVQSSYDFLLSKYMILEGVGKLVDAIILNSPSYNQMRLNDVVKNDEGFDGAMKFDKDGLNRFKNSHTQFIPITLHKDSNQEEKISMESACYEVKATTLNVRKKPSLKSKTIGQKHRGEVVCSSKKDKNWVKIGDGQWVYDEYLVVQNESF